MFGEERKPELLLEVLSDLISSKEVRSDKIRVTYAGKDSAVWHDKMLGIGLSEILDDRGLVSRKEALNIQQKSSINLLLTYSSDKLKGNITGKLFEYFNARRPVLVMINGPQDQEIEDLVRPELGIVAYHSDYNSVRDFVLHEYKAWERGDSGDSQFDYQEALKPFTWDMLARNFARHIGIA
jgi:hypothetical protein